MQKSAVFGEEHSRRFAPSILIISKQMSESNANDTEKNKIPEDEVDKKKIYATEKKIFVDWIKAVCGRYIAADSCLEKSLDEVKLLADQYITAGSVSNLKSLFEELSDAEGHRTIHFAVSRNHIDTVNWILDNDPDCVSGLEWVLMGRLT